MTRPRQIIIDKTTLVPLGAVVLLSLAIGWVLTLRADVDDLKKKAGTDQLFKETVISDLSAIKTKLNIEDKKSSK